MVNKYVFLLERDIILFFYLFVIIMIVGFIMSDKMFFVYVILKYVDVMF